MLNFPTMVTFLLILIVAINIFTTFTYCAVNATSSWFVMEQEEKQPYRKMGGIFHAKVRVAFFMVLFAFHMQAYG